MKSIVKEIFKNVYAYTDLGQVCDKELSDAVHSLIEMLNTDLDKNDIGNLMFDASGYGQELGFISGFKLGVQLMCECKSL